MKRNQGAKGCSPLYLDLAEFHRLDRISRAHAKVPIQVVTSAQLGGRFAGVSPTAQGCYESWDPSARVVRETALIELSNVIDFESATPYYGINWQQLPRTRIYEFVVWHEISHIIHGDLVASFRLFHSDKRDEFLAFQEAMEIRANRYAWNHMFSLPMPGSLTDRWHYHHQTLEKYGHLEPPFDRPSIPLDTDHFIPWCHHEAGIPFEVAVKSTVHRKRSHHGDKSANRDEDLPQGTHGDKKSKGSKARSRLKPDQLAQQ